MRFSKAERNAVFAKTQGVCHHCKASISIDNFDIDHFPVRKSDIEDQCFCCGVTDIHDINNLVPSCANCNRSHKYESTKYCGHSQIRIRKSYIIKTLAITLATTLGYLAGHFIR